MLKPCVTTQDSPDNNIIIYDGPAVLMTSGANCSGIAEEFGG